MSQNNTDPRVFEMLKSLNQEMKKIVLHLNTLNGRMSKLESTFDDYSNNSQKSMQMTMENVMDVLSKKFENLAENIGTSLNVNQEKFTNQQSKMDKNIRRRFEVERKLDEERSKVMSEAFTQQPKYSSSPTTSKSMYGSMFSINKSIGRRRRRKRKISFDNVERLIRNGRSSGKKVISLVDRLIADLNIDGNAKLDRAMAKLKNIKQRVAFQTSQTIADYTKEIILSELDKAESIYTQVVGKTTDLTQTDLN